MPIWEKSYNESAYQREQEEGERKNSDYNTAESSLNNDALIRDTNPSFQHEVEQQVLRSLRNKMSPDQGISRAKFRQTGHVLET